MEYTLGWIFAGIVLACVLVSSILLQTRANERIQQLTAELANSRKNENVAAACLNLEVRARIAAEALAVAYRDEMAKKDALGSHIGALAANLREQHQDLSARIMLVLAAMTPDDTETELETELERIAKMGAEAALDKRPGLLADDHLALGATLGAVMTLHNYTKLALVRLLGEADARLGAGGQIPCEAIEPVPDSRRGRVVPFRRTREHEGPPSSNPAPVSG